MRNTQRFVLLAVVGVLFSCATLPSDVDRPLSHAFPDTNSTVLGRRVAKRAADHPKNPDSTC